MLYREAGQFKSSYEADAAVFPLREDRIGLAVILLIAFGVIPFVSNDFMLQAVLIPFLVFSLAAIGLNILTGYTGLVSLGTGAFMGVGAYACYKLTTYFPGVNIIILVVASGFFWFIKSCEYETANPGQDFDDLEASVFNPEVDLTRPVISPNAEVPTARSESRDRTISGGVLGEGAHFEQHSRGFSESSTKPGNRPV